MADVIGGLSLEKAGSSPVERPNHPVPHVSTGSRGPPAQEVAAREADRGRHSCQLSTSCLPGTMLGTSPWTPER